MDDLYKVDTADDSGGGGGGGAGGGGGGGGDKGDEGLALLQKGVKAREARVLSCMRSLCKARVESALTPMDADGKKAARDIAASLRPGSTTNLWDGIATGLGVLRDAPREGVRAIQRWL